MGNTTCSDDDSNATSYHCMAPLWIVVDVFANKIDNLNAAAKTIFNELASSFP